MNGNKIVFHIIRVGIIIKTTRNAKHETRNAKRETRNTKHETRNAKRETRNAKHGTRNTKHETIGRVLTPGWNISLMAHHYLTPIPLHFNQLTIESVFLIKKAKSYSTIYFY